MAGRWHCMAVGGVRALAACGDSRGAHQAPGPATEYAGVSLERLEELPATGDVALAVTTDNPAAGKAEFSRSCARRLRDPRNGGELLLMHSQISTSMSKKGDTTVTQLVHAAGDYAPMTDDQRGKGEPLLRVDCVTGQAVSWVVVPER